MLFTRFFRLLWVLFFILFIFLDRDEFVVKAGLIIFILVLSFITIGRILDSRNEWRKIVKDDLIE